MKSIHKIHFFTAAALILTAAAVFISVCVGAFPLTPQALASGDAMALRVFYTLRLPRVLMALVSGFVLGVCGGVYQSIFKNPLASPDIIGVSSGASLGAAAAILFFSGSFFATTLCAFIFGLAAVVLALMLSRLGREDSLAATVLAGIAVGALAQALLMILKLTADPEKQLAAIEYWIMGSLNGVTLSRALPAALLGLAACAVVLTLHRQVLLLSVGDEEASMLGVRVQATRFGVLLAATLGVTATISVTGLISFVGLLAPHIARLITGDNRLPTLYLGGLTGSLILLVADIFSRSLAASELPVSVFTSLLGAPFMIYLMAKGGKIRGTL